MTIKVKSMGGRSGSIDADRESHTLFFDAWSTDTRWPSIQDLYAAVNAAAPSFFNGLPVQSVRWDEDEENGTTTFEVNYGSDAPAESNLKVSFDTTGGTVRVRSSRATQSYPAAGRTAPDFKGAIEVSGGEPQGVDAVIPALKLNFDYRWPKGTITINDAKFIAGLTGRTNSSNWFGFAPGELLFLGASGTIDLAVPTELSYSFVASANATVSIGSWITNIQKAGHDHLWVAFEEVDDSSAKKVVPRPLAAYVERIYEQADFFTLGIGG